MTGRINTGQTAAVGMSAEGGNWRSDTGSGEAGGTLTLWGCEWERCCAGKYGDGSIRGAGSRGEGGEWPKKVES